IDLIVTALAIQKAGAGWLPLEPGLPDERLAFMLADAQPHVVLATTATEKQLRAAEPGPPTGCSTLILDDPATKQMLANLGDASRTWCDRPRPLPDHPAYLLYTSGSTGRPKGVVISRRSLSGYIAHVAGRVLDGDAAVMPLFTPVSFDLTLTTIFAPLCTGGQLYVLPEGPPEQLLAEAFSAELGATAVKLTPSHLSLLATLPAAPSCVRTAIVGGEALAPAQV